MPGPLANRMTGDNCYEDSRRAEAYSTLGFINTYYLAYRDLPKIIAAQATGRTALDFGCGTGRSTRFLRSLGFDVIGADISGEMIQKARAVDPYGDYRLIRDGDFSGWPDRSFDVILSAFTFDNIAGRDRKVAIFRELHRLLNPEGRIVNLVSAPEIYTHEWASFSTRDYPENRDAKSGDMVKIVVTDHEDRRPVEDILWGDKDYRSVYRQAGLELLETHRPLATEQEPFPWVNETRIAPWAIYVLARAREGVE